MIQLHPEFLTKNGKREFVVLPYDEYVALEELLEDAQDLLDLRAAKEVEGDQPSTPLADVKKNFGL